MGVCLNEKTLNAALPKDENHKPVHTTEFSVKNRIGEIIHEIECALENMDIDYINEFEEEINLLSYKFTDDSDISMLADYFTESKQEITKQIQFDETKKIMKETYIKFGMDEETAEEEADNFAWQELYSK